MEIIAKSVVNILNNKSELVDKKINEIHLSTYQVNMINRCFFCVKLMILNPG